MTDAYVSGEEPMRGYVIAFEPQGSVPTVEYWIVIGIQSNMVRAKLRDATGHKQAHFTNQMTLIERQK
jgi:hypothetical protein